MFQYDYNEWSASDRLLQEIQESSISTEVDYITTTETTTSIFFVTELTLEEETVLDSLVSLHSGEHLDPDPVAIPLYPHIIQLEDTVSTSSSVYSVISGMEYTIEETGTYTVHFSSAIQLSGNNSGDIIIYKNNAQVSGTTRSFRISNSALLASSALSSSCAINYTTELTSGDVLDIRFRENDSGIFYVRSRDFVITRVL